MNSIHEHCGEADAGDETEEDEAAEVVEEKVLALGLGSRKPRPMISTGSAYLSSSNARSMADGCRRMQEVI